MIVARTVLEAREALAALPRPLGLAPTMGALHDGHLALLAAAKDRCAGVAASLFVNPMQFGAGEDFAAYPRDEARDLALFDEAGVDFVFVPAAAEMYPDGFCTSVHVTGALSEDFEGAERAGHFDGVATVVTKLFTICRPDVAFFGQKDAQQLALLRRVSHDLDLDVEIVGVPTVREQDGLARSSRNAYLTREQRAVAPDLYRALLAGAKAAEAPGATPKDAIVAAAAALALPAVAANGEERVAALTGEAPPAPPRFDLDYIAVVDADSFEQERAFGPRPLLIAGARLGGTRLIDNLALHPGAYPAQDATA